MLPRSIAMRLLSSASERELSLLMMRFFEGLGVGPGYRDQGTSALLAVSETLPYFWA
jgi:hypothetical protein